MAEIDVAKLKSLQDDLREVSKRTERLRVWLSLWITLQSLEGNYRRFHTEVDQAQVPALPSVLNTLFSMWRGCQDGELMDIEVLSNPLPGFGGSTDTPYRQEVADLYQSLNQWTEPIRAAFRDQSMPQLQRACADFHQAVLFQTRRARDYVNTEIGQLCTLTAQLWKPLEIPDRLTAGDGHQTIAPAGG